MFISLLDSKECPNFYTDYHSSRLELPFEIMCDASDYTFGAILGQKEEEEDLPCNLCKSHNHKSLNKLCNNRKGALNSGVHI